MTDATPFNEQDFYRYYGRVDRIIDGDTIVCYLDCGLETFVRKTLRLLSVDTAEVYGVSHSSEEFRRGTQHSQFVHEWLKTTDDREWPLVVETEKDDTGKYGRYLARVYRRSDGAVLNCELIREFPETATD